MEYIRRRYERKKSYVSWREQNIITYIGDALSVVHSAVHGNLHERAVHLTLFQTLHEIILGSTLRQQGATIFHQRRDAEREAMQGGLNTVSGLVQAGSKKKSKQK